MVAHYIYKLETLDSVKHKTGSQTSVHKQVFEERKFVLRRGQTCNPSIAHKI